jgi:iron(II)-dependent oxidoreductase
VTPGDTIAVPRMRVRIGLTTDEADRLARELAAMEEAYDEGGLRGSSFELAESIARRRRALEVAMPAHEVEVGPFEIAVYPVTKAQWARYVAETGAKPADGPKAAPPNSFVTGVSQHEARAYALHYQLDLPTEAEWEAAARDGRSFFPWGDRFFPTGERAYRAPLLEPYVVGSRPETKSARGVHDLIGQFGEYTCDPFGPYPGADTASFEARFPSWRDQIAVRGGYDPDQTSTCVSRRGVPPGERRSHLTFRCVRRA